MLFSIVEAETPGCSHAAIGVTAARIGEQLSPLVSGFPVDHLVGNRGPVCGDNARFQRIGKDVSRSARLMIALNNDDFGRWRRAGLSSGAGKPKKQEGGGKTGPAN